MTRRSNHFVSALFAGAMMGAAAVPAQAADVNLVFLVDESGSMGGEHGFLQTFVPQVESDLTSLASLSSSYGLIGYGGPSSGAPRQFQVGGADFGTASEFVTAANSLVTSGGFEDGYAAIDFALQNLTFDPSAKVSFVLVTDEDRDITSGSNLDYNAILSALQAEGIALTGILDQSLQDGAGSQTAVGTDGTDSYIADGSGGFSIASGVTYGSAFGTTKADYTDLAIATGGCVADLDQLRLGGNTAASFSGAFLNCLTQAIQQQSPGGIVSVLSNHPMVRVVYVNRQIGIGIGYDFRNRLSVRRVAARQGLSTPMTAFNIDEGGVSLGQQEFAARYGYTGLRGGAASADTKEAEQARMFDRSRLGFFIGGDLSKGDIDATTNNPSVDFQVKSLNGGVDYQFKDDLIAGVGLGYVNTDSDIGTAAGNADISGASLIVYGSYFPQGGVYVDGSLSYSWLENDTTRVSGVNTMTGSTDSRQFSASVQAGMDRQLREDVVVTPFAGMSYTDVTIDGYTESGVAPLTLQDNSAQSLTGELGVKLSKRLHRSAGSMVLSGEAALVHEFEDDPAQVTAVSGNTVYSSLTDSLDSNYIRLGLGVAAELRKDVSLHVSYSTVLAHDELSSHSVGARLRIELD